MKILALVLACAVAAVSAQSVGGPSCAQPCFLTAISNTACGFDPACLCKSSTFINAVSVCIQKDCDSADQATALSYAEGICKAASVPISVAFPSGTKIDSSNKGSASNGTVPSSSTTATLPTKTKNAARQMEIGGGIVGGLVMLMVL